MPIKLLLATVKLLTTVIRLLKKTCRKHDMLQSTLMRKYFSDRIIFKKCSLNQHLCFFFVEKHGIKAPLRHYLSVLERCEQTHQ